jgi:hypothetical protein
MPRNLLTAASSAGTAALLLLVVSACGGGSDNTASSTPASGTQPQNQSAGPGPGGGQGFPGASGKVAAISGKTLQVQSQQSGQVAVTYTGKTTFTESVKANAAAVRVGSCISVRSSADRAMTATGSDPVTAASVATSDPVNGQCGPPGGFGGGGFTRTGTGGPLPSGAPSGGPGGAAGGRGPAGALPVSGKVTAVSGSIITVAAVRFQDTGTDATASPSATPSTSTVKVTTTSATTYTKTVKATAKDLAVGQCVTAVGSADDTGAVTATAIASQPAVNGECNAGFGPPRMSGGSGSGGSASGGTS